MALSGKDIHTMDDLFLHTLQDIYYAEKQIEKALPKMIDKARSSELKSGFKQHLEETAGHVERLEKVFGLLGKTPKAVTCPAIDGIIKEDRLIADDIDDAGVMDAALAAAAQAVEHYEMTRYGTLIAWSKALGRKECADLFAQTLEEEKATDAKLSKLAETRLNRAA
jgi:ferritin-like metal-binding protein YciE